MDDLSPEGYNNLRDVHYLSWCAMVHSMCSSSLIVYLHMYLGVLLYNGLRRGAQEEVEVEDPSNSAVGNGRCRL